MACSNKRVGGWLIPEKGLGMACSSKRVGGWPVPVKGLGDGLFQ